jgi:flagellar basal body-associated protein FliL
MKSVKIYLIVVFVLLLLALASGIAVWYLYQNLDGAQPNIVPTTLDTENTDTETPVTPLEREPVTTDAPITLTADSLGEKQREVLTSFGLEGAKVTLTPEKINCAKDVLGQTRFDEVVNGAAPTPLEAVGLLGCLK